MKSYVGVTILSLLGRIWKVLRKVLHKGLLSCSHFGGPSKEWKVLVTQLKSLHKRFGLLLWAFLLFSPPANKVAWHFPTVWDFISLGARFYVLPLSLCRKEGHLEMAGRPSWTEKRLFSSSQNGFHDPSQNRFVQAGIKSANISLYLEEARIFFYIYILFQ